MMRARPPTKSFVIGLVAWSALVLTPVVIVGPAMAAALLLLALALATCVTLRYSLPAGILAAAGGACLFTVALGLLEAPGQLSPNLAAAARSIGQAVSVLPALLAAGGLAGAVAFAELVSLSLEWGDGPGDTGRPAGPPRRVSVTRRR